MNPRHLRNFATRYGAIGLLLVGAYVLLRHLWERKRAQLLLVLAILCIGVYVLASSRARYVHRDGLTLYAPPHTQGARQGQSVKERLLLFWTDKERTAYVLSLVGRFDQEVGKGNQLKAAALANQLTALVPPPKMDWYEDVKWHFRATIGQIYLERAWLDAAHTEFSAVIKAVPPPKAMGWGRSLSRQDASYGLAWENALRGDYAKALEWNSQAPGEFNGGCGNANEAERVRNYPTQQVWKAARQPYPASVRTLKQIMAGRFDPMETRLNGDTSDEQRQHAAVEAGLTLGCVYMAQGDRRNAEAAWSLTAANADSGYEATGLARVMLEKPHRR